jgi:hypothetical protein
LAAAKEPPMAIEMVRVYDVYTNQMTTIPAAELVPGMLRTWLPGIEGDIWIDGTKALAEQALHPEFDEKIRKCLRRLSSVFCDVYPKLVVEWECGLRCVENPEKVIALWLHIENCFLHFTAGRDLNLEQRTDIFRVIFAVVDCPKDKVHFWLRQTTLSREEVQEIAEYVNRTRS